MILPQCRHTRPLIQLALTGTLQSFRRPGGQTDLTPALCGLRGSEDWMSVPRSAQAAPNLYSIRHNDRISMSYSHCYYITAGSLVHECIRLNAFDCCCRAHAPYNLCLPKSRPATRLA